MPHKRSKLSIEERKAKRYVYKNSRWIKQGEKDNVEIPERVFTKTAVELTGAVLAMVGDARETVVPEYPQGLVLESGRGGGYFDPSMVPDLTVAYR